MNFIFRKIFIILFCFSFVFSANTKVVAAISTMKGLVMVKPSGSRKYIPAYKGQMIKSGEWIKTKDGVFVAIVFLDGSNIKIQQQTEVKITSYRMTAKDLKTNLNMSKGQAWSDVADQGSGGEFVITTPTAVASVKGTEFDLAYDAENDETTLIVVEGEISFEGELGTIMAKAMQSSKNGADPIDIKPEDIPTWQKSTDPSFVLKLKPDKKGKQKVEEIIKVNIQILNAKSKIFNDSFKGIVTVSSQSSDLILSADGSSWSNSVNVSINRGRGVIQVKSSRQGRPAMIASADDTESKIIEFEYYQSNTQKRASQDKLGNLTKVKENSKLSKLIQENILLRSQIIKGFGNVNGILQKLETGELEIDGDPTLNNNGDGTYTVKMIVKPR